MPTTATRTKPVSRCPSTESPRPTTAAQTAQPSNISRRRPTRSQSVADAATNTMLDQTAQRTDRPDEGAAVAEVGVRVDGAGTCYPCRRSPSRSGCCRRPAEFPAVAAAATPRSAPWESSFVFCSSTNTGVSSIRSLTHSAIPINTALIRNGIRQPHCMNARLFSPMLTFTPRNVRQVKDRCGPAAEQGEHPVPTALGRRRVFGAQQHRSGPFAAGRKPLQQPQPDQDQRGRGSDGRRVGTSPTETVATAMISSVAIRLRFRPNRSPK